MTIIGIENTELAYDSLCVFFFFLQNFGQRSTRNHQGNPAPSDIIKTMTWARRRVLCMREMVHRVDPNATPRRGLDLYSNTNALTDRQVRPSRQSVIH